MHDADHDGPLPDEEYPKPPLREYVIVWRDYLGKNHGPKVIWAPYPDAIPSVPVEQQHKKFRYWKMWEKSVWDAQENV